jgi:hypothetical protein
MCLIKKKITWKEIVLTSFILLASYDAKSTEPLFEPYGAKFGQKFDVNQHKTMARRGNIRTVKLRTTNRPDDTEELLAEICDDHGLQVITWRSHIRSPSSALASHNNILKRFKKKFGAPKIKHKSAFWTSKELSIVVKIRDKNITHQNQIRYFGPKNVPCFEKFMTYLKKTK